jgi:flagellar biosynthesis/type III secretory pathway protein FliH
LERGLEEASRQYQFMMGEAEELLVELQDARTAMLKESHAQAVDLALTMTRRLLGLLPEEMPRVLRPALERLVEDAEVGQGAVVRCHPLRSELLRQLPSVTEGRVRLEVDRDSPPGRMRVHGPEGVGELDFEKGLEKMEEELRSLLRSQGAGA